MKFVLWVASFALCSAKAIPTRFLISENADLKHQGLDSLAWDLEPRAQKTLSFSQVKKEMAKEFKVKATDGELKLKWNVKTECSKCKGNQVQDLKNKSKCKNCKKGMKPNSNHTKCVKDDTSCAKDEIQKSNNKCEKCPKGQTPDKDGKKCKKQKDEKDEKDDKQPGNEKGKCPDGQILDPAEGGQDSKTEKPKCILDDDKKCPKGQSAVSRLTSNKINESKYNPICMRDDKPDFKCKDKKTYDHRDDGDDDKIKHTCRSTRKAQDDKKKKYKKHVDDAKDKKKNGDSDKKDKKRCKHAGWYFAVLTAIQADSFKEGDVKDLSKDEIDGMMSLWPDDDVPDPQDIPDHVVSLEAINLVVPVVQKRWFGNLIKGLGKGGKGGGKGGKGGDTGGHGLKKALDEVKDNLKPASKKSVKNAEKSSRVQKMTKVDSYLDCLGTTSALVSSPKSKRDSHPWKNIKIKGEAMTLKVDWSRERDSDLKKLPEDTPSDKTIRVSIGKDTDESDAKYKAYVDGFNRVHCLQYKGCTKIESYLDNSVTDIQTEGGCCTFYDSGKCKGTPLFSMYNREDGQLKGDDNNAISSFWYTFDEVCKGAPGHKG